MSLLSINLNLNSGPAFDKLATWFIGTVYPEGYIRGIRAEAEARRILAEPDQRLEPPVDDSSALEVARKGDDLERRARELAVLAHASENIDDDAEPAKVDDDWRAAARSFIGGVSSEQMRRFWGKLIAEQVNSVGQYSGGRYSIQTLHVLASMSRYDAVRFTELCGYAVHHEDMPFLMYRTDEETSSPPGRGIFRRVSFRDYKVLLGLGLIIQQPEALTWFQQRYYKRMHFHYGDHWIVATAGVKMS